MQPDYNIKGKGSTSCSTQIDWKILSLIIKTYIAWMDEFFTRRSLINYHIITDERPPSERPGDRLA